MIDEIHHKNPMALGGGFIKTSTPPKLQGKSHTKDHENLKCAWQPTHKGMHLNRKIRFSQPIISSVGDEWMSSTAWNISNISHHLIGQLKQYTPPVWLYTKTLGWVGWGMLSSNQPLRSTMKDSALHNCSILQVLQSQKHCTVGRQGKG